MLRSLRFEFWRNEFFCCLGVTFLAKTTQRTMAKSVSGTAPFGQQGAQMLINLRRAAWLPQYDADGNNKVTEEIQDLYKKIHNTLMAAKDVDTNKPEAYAISCSVIVHHHALLR